RPSAASARSVQLPIETDAMSPPRTRSAIRARRARDCGAIAVPSFCARGYHSWAKVEQIRVAPTANRSYAYFLMAAPEVRLGHSFLSLVRSPFSQHRPGGAQTSQESA